MSDSPLEGPLPLARHHDVDDFHCGEEALNSWLKKFGLVNQSSDAARTYVMARGKRVVAFYSLAYGSVEPAAATSRIRKGLARHPIPVMVLARLAVDKSEQGRGIGASLLRDALLRTLQASEIAGLRAIVVHAKSDAARKFYELHHFERSPLDEHHLMLLLKELKEVLGRK